MQTDQKADQHTDQQTSYSLDSDDESSYATVTRLNIIVDCDNDINGCCDATHRIVYSDNIYIMCDYHNVTHKYDLEYKLIESLSPVRLRPELTYKPEQIVNISHDEIWNSMVYPCEKYLFVGIYDESDYRHTFSIYPIIPGSEPIMKFKTVCRHMLTCLEHNDLLYVLTDAELTICNLHLGTVVHQYIENNNIRQPVYFSTYIHFIEYPDDFCFMPNGDILIVAKYLVYKLSCE